MDKAFTNDKISIDTVKRLSHQTLIGVSATALNSIILALLLLGVIEKYKVLLWLVIALIISAARFLIQLRIRKKKLTPENVGRQRFFLLFALTLSGCIWGAVSVFLFPYSSFPHQVLIAFILGGMVAGSVGTFASIMAAFYAFSIPALLPLIVVFFSIHDGMHVGMGIMVAIFWVFMFMTAKRLNSDILQSMSLRYVNLDLIVELEREIRDRKIAEKELLMKHQQIESIVNERTAELLRVNEDLLEEINERKEVEKALRESEEKFRELADSLPQIVFETNLHGELTFANRNAYELFGYTEDDIRQGVSAFQMLVSESNNHTFEKIQTVLSSKNTDGNEYIARRKDGSIFPVAIHSTPVIRDGKQAGMRGIIIDLTEKKQSEEEQKQLEVQLHRAQKMELLGTLAGGVAHDLNNILSGIVNYPELLLMEIPEDSPLRESILAIQKSGVKAAATVQDLLTLTRRGVISEEVLNLNHIVSEYIKSPEHENLMLFHPEVAFESVLEKDLLNIMGSPVHITKTVMNLVSNAAEAMPDGGKVIISTSNRYLDKPVSGYDDIKEGDYAILTVSDSGIGISGKDIERIFEPFYTKKVMGRSGTGLGMAVVWGTVKDHKGYIDVTSAEGRGSAFSLYFPVTRKELKIADTPYPVMQYRGKGESILVVDDVEEQRRIASEMLLRLGYRVIVVSSGEEAIDYLIENKVDLIVLDMIMDPGMDGLNTYKKIVEIQPNQKAIIASGFSETDRVKEAQMIGAGPYIKKPYTLIKLGHAVRMELDGADPASPQLAS